MTKGSFLRRWTGALAGLAGIGSASVAAIKTPEVTAILTGVIALVAIAVVALVWLVVTASDDRPVNRLVKLIKALTRQR